MQPSVIHAPAIVKVDGPPTPDSETALPPGSRRFLAFLRYLCFLLLNSDIFLQKTAKEAKRVDDLDSQWFFVFLRYLRFLLLNSDPFFTEGSEGSKEGR